MTGKNQDEVYLFAGVGYDDLPLLFRRFGHANTHRQAYLSLVALRLLVTAPEESFGPAFLARLREDRDAVEGTRSYDDMAALLSYVVKNSHELDDLRTRVSGLLSAARRDRLALELAQSFEAELRKV